MRPFNVGYTAGTSVWSYGSDTADVGHTAGTSFWSYGSGTAGNATNIVIAGVDMAEMTKAHPRAETPLEWLDRRVQEMRVPLA